MPEIQSPDPGRKLQRRYSLTGATPAPFLSPEIVPVCLVDDLTDLDILEATFQRPCAGRTTIAAGGAGVAAVQSLVNPIGSGVTCTVERVFSWAGTSSTLYEFYIVAGVVPNFGLRHYRDSRIPGLPACQLRVETIAARAQQGFAIPVVTGFDHIRPVPLRWVLGPGQALRAHDGTNNQVGNMAWEWSERLVETG